MPADKPKPTHYRVVCISLYIEDIAALEQLVARAKMRGYSRANKSEVIRRALGQINMARAYPPRRRQAKGDV